MSTQLSSAQADATSAESTAWSCILFDLDGTIVDSAPGIIARLALTLEELGLPAQSPSELMRWVGPPLLDSFRDYAGLDEAGSWEGVHAYRRLVASVGASDNSETYPGVPELLGAIRAAGIPLSLATSKPESQALDILEHFGMTADFTVICGASDDETRSAKADVIAEALRRLGELDVDLSNPIMVGDRHHDIDGAAAHNIPTLLVSWGYAKPGEEAGALEVIATAEVLGERLLG
ncbi:HAD hydrolase-like protein [Mycetocola spongiae]|uniref:HAD hydrolase-like protein n=1 Tax=Mycetocola spongiae TaxID=2859226 RepID=UPI001CF27942|nr:HAD hydrolase-like protein [Mycetocola spongiae]UCR88214.1 HAD hydrolase-like protein [Mycetocola spongiae]